MKNILYTLLCAYSIFSSLEGIAQTGPRNYAAAETDVHYQEMHIEIDPAVNHVEGVISFVFSGKVDLLNRFVVDYADELPINYIRRGNADLNYSRADNLITIDLGKNLALDESDTVTISFESDETLRREMHAGVPVISTDLDLGMLWYPGKRDLVDKIDSVDMYVTTPLGQRVASNGTLESLTEENGKLIHHWQHRHPIATTYLLQLAITNYTVVEDSVLLKNGNYLPLQHYLYPESLATIVPEVNVTPDVMQFFETHFGPYPFSDEKYGHAQYTAGGALEVQTMPFMGFFNLTVIAHELAHQWFGNTVTFGSWSDIWLSEGWAEYLSGLAIEALKPIDWNGVKTTKISSITSLPGGSVFVTDTNNLNAIFDGRLTYNKGFYLAHMLRWIVGDSAFFEAARNYLHDPVHYDGFARNIDLQNHFEAVSGIDLDEYFADWYYGEGYPSYTLNWEQVADSVIIYVDQVQSHPSVSYFEMPLPVAAYRFGIVADTVFHHSYEHQRFAMYVGNVNVSTLLFDQDKWILSKNNKIVKMTTAVSDLESEKIKVYPNPASDYLEILGGEEIREIEFVDVRGVSILKNIKAGRVSLTEIPNGPYTLVMRDRYDRIVSMEMIVIQK